LTASRSAPSLPLSCSISSWSRVVAAVPGIFPRLVSTSHDPTRSKDLVVPYKNWLDFQNKYWEAVYQRNLAALDVLLGSGLILHWPGLVGSAPL